MLAAEIRNHDFSDPSLGKDSCSENTCGSFIRVSECIQFVLLFRKLLSLKSHFDVKKHSRIFLWKIEIIGFYSTTKPINPSRDRSFLEKKLIFRDTVSQTS